MIPLAVSLTNAASPLAALHSLPTPRPGDIDAALRLAQALGARRANPGDGSTREQWELLASLASEDLAVARAIEPHLDAVAILVQAGWPETSGRLGVFAAEGGEHPLTASAVGDRWVLNGVKPWCSLADRLDAALVTAHVTSGEARLFLVDLGASGVHMVEQAWQSRGLSEIPSGPVRFAEVEAQPVGEPGWYLSRPGFAWGGIGVAACWYGGAVGIGRTVLAAARETPNPFLLAHLGAIDVLLQACRTALADAAQRADEHADDDRRPDGWQLREQPSVTRQADDCAADDRAAGELQADEQQSDDQRSVRLLARRVRGLVARACEEVIMRAGHALGPAPLALDAAHAKRVADLQLYVRQHHAERDDAALGERIAAAEGTPW